MTNDEYFKSVRGTILERINKEGYQDYDDFSTIAAKTVTEGDSTNIRQDRFKKEVSSHATGFFRFNQVEDRSRFLELVFSDIEGLTETSTKGDPRQIYIEDIDSFSDAAEVEASDLEIDDRLEISEEEVKNRLREIINEPFTQADWGGEQNDLFTSEVRLNDDRVDTAFMLKGPSVSGEMYVSDAGKRGDQVQRLFESPADLFIVQFNGKFEDRLIKHIKEQAEVANAGYYCIMNGTDTARVLEAYDLL
ncbi:hypothetical protein [Halosimplex marinum]|uniref:hypothetical protein n=1 Tax=Halosimplex marinum TaxID=3396620 RepID=UPI003F5786EA